MFQIFFALRSRGKAPTKLQSHRKLFELLMFKLGHQLNLGGVPAKRDSDEFVSLLGELQLAPYQRRKLIVEFLDVISLAHDRQPKKARAELLTLFRKLTKLSKSGFRQALSA